MAAMTGASTAELMKRLRHKSARAALIYQHATIERDREIADSLGVMISAAVPAALPARTPPLRASSRAKSVPGNVPGAPSEPARWFPVVSSSDTEALG